MSARGLSFSARKRAVMTPVESRTHTISTSGTAASDRLLERAELVVLERGVDVEPRFLRYRRGNEPRAAMRPSATPANANLFMNSPVLCDRPIAIGCSRHMLG